MKVAIVANPFAKIPAEKYGGTELVIANLIKGLKEAGHEPILLGTGDSTIDCPIIPITDQAEFYPKNPKDVPAFRKRVAYIHKKTGKLLAELLPEVDVIHSNGFDIKDFADFPHVITLHNPFLLKGTDFYFNPLSVGYFEERKHLNYVSISYNQRQGCPNLNYISNVYHGEDTEAFPIVTKPKNYVCFLGRLDPDKNPHLAILLAIKMGIKIKLGAKLDFEGRDYFRKHIKPYLNHPLVEYLGELDFKQKVKLISNAKCNLHPTGFREPFGLTIIEAAYCGTPTMAIRRGSMPELIKDGSTGILVEDFIEGCFVLDKTFSFSRRYIAKRTRRKFTYQKMTEGYVHAYRRAIRKANRSENSL